MLENVWISLKKQFLYLNIHYNMKSLNRVELKGTVCGDPKITTVEGGRRVANISLATDYPWQDRDGKWQHDTDWHNVVAWEGYGITNLDSIRKGVFLCVIGRLRTRKYTDRSGVDKFITEVLADDLDVIERDQPRQQQQTARPASAGAPRNNRPSNDDDF